MRNKANFRPPAGVSSWKSQVSSGASQVSGLQTSNLILRDKRLATSVSRCAKQSQFRGAKIRNKAKVRLRAGVSSLKFQVSRALSWVSGFPTLHFTLDTSGTDYAKQSQFPAGPRGTGGSLASPRRRHDILQIALDGEGRIRSISHRCSQGGPIPPGTGGPEQSIRILHDQNHRILAIGKD